MSKKRENKTSKLVEVGAEEVARQVVENKPDKHIYDGFSDYCKWTCCVNDIRELIPVFHHINELVESIVENDVLSWDNETERRDAILRGLWQTADGAVAHIINLAKNGGLGQGADDPTPEALDTSTQ